MTELERRALMGDREAQQECTRQGIVLRCPFCGNEKNIISNWGMFRCWCPVCLAKAEDSLTRIDALKSWNTRPATPVGRCGECKHLDDTGTKPVCWHTGLPLKSENDFCSYFEPKGNERNIDHETLPLVQDLKDHECSGLVEE